MMQIVVNKLRNHILYFCAVLNNKSGFRNTTYSMLLHTNMIPTPPTQLLRVVVMSTPLKTIYTKETMSFRHFPHNLVSM